MDQSLVHTFSWGNLHGPMVLKVLLKFPPTLALVHGWLFPAMPSFFGVLSGPPPGTVVDGGRDHNLITYKVGGLHHAAHLFLRARKKKIFLFSGGATSSRTVPKTQPLQVAFSLRERVDLRSQKGRILGRKIAWGRVGRTGQKKEKRTHKKKGGAGEGVCWERKIHHVM